MKSVEINVDIRHLTRVEGHGNIQVRVRDGKVTHAQWEVVETPRFFEVMLKGKPFGDAAMLTARICGICSIGHTLASLRATERAFGVEIPPLAGKMRLLAKHGETLQSHFLHLFFLAAPDFLGLPSAIPLMEKEPMIFDLACKLKGLANRLCDVVAGRTTHPVSLQPGGLAARPNLKALGALREELCTAMADVELLLIDLFRSFEIPDFTRETEYVSLASSSDYPWIGGDLISSDGVRKSEDDYLDMTHEEVVEFSTSKFCSLSRDSFAVGPLARFNNNHERLHPTAQKVATALGLTAPCYNPYFNNIAQLVECVHCCAESVELIESICADPAGEIRVPVTPRKGLGISAVEVPRGILYHCYQYDDQGRIERADCVIPTTQNNKNIHLDLPELASWYAAQGRSDQELERLCAMLVRAYDPCISCSVH